MEVTEQPLRGLILKCKSLHSSIRVLCGPYVHVARNVRITGHYGLLIPEARPDEEDLFQVNICEAPMPGFDRVSHANFATYLVTSIVFIWDKI